MSIDHETTGSDKSELTATTQEERIAAARLDVIKQQIEQSLAKANPLEAAFGTISGDLFLMAFQIKRELDDLTDGDSEFAPEPDQVAAIREQYLKVIKQLERINNLVTELSGDGRTSAARRAAGERRDETPPSGESHI
jgi:hypothetical protein